MNALQRRLTALLALIALLSFVAGAGLDALSVIPAGLVLLAAVFVQPGEELSRRLEPFWRGAAVLLALRAAWRVLAGAGDPVLPMVDLLLLLLCAESLRTRDGSGDARHFALTFALLIASAAYRPGPLFGILFVAYVVCGTLVLALGHEQREARGQALRAPAARRRQVRHFAAMSLVVVGVSVAVFLFFPRASRGWSPRGTPIASAVVGFSDRVSIGSHGARIEPNPQVVLRIEFPQGRPLSVRNMRWRGRAYDRFDGVTWSRSHVQPEPRLETAWDLPLIEQLVYARPLTDANVLFGLHPIYDISARSPVRPRRAAHGDWTYLGDADPGYLVRSRAGRPGEDVLRTVAAPRMSEAILRNRQGAGGAEALRNLQLPPISGRLLALADSFRAAAPTMYDHVIMVEEWLRTGFGYTLELPRTRREATLEHFIFERRAGHCEYFSTAMAVLLRAGGVPARNVNGFLGGDWNEFGQFLAVTQNHAHSWVEVLFPGVGWVEFDPTPASPAAAAGVATRWFGQGARMLDGLAHRWNKWILDYDMTRQTSLLRHVLRPFGDADPPAAAPAEGRRPAVGALAAVAGALVLLVIAVLYRLRRARRAPGGAATPHYLALRRAYERAGVAGAGALPPLAFARAVAGRPGGADARRAVDLYVQARFGGRPLTPDEARALQRSVSAARRALRRPVQSEASGSVERGNAGR